MGKYEGHTVTLISIYVTATDKTLGQFDASFALDVYCLTCHLVVLCQWLYCLIRQMHSEESYWELKKFHFNMLRKSTVISHVVYVFNKNV